MNRRGAPPALRSTHLIFVVLTEAHAILEEGQQGEIVLQGLRQGDGHPRLARVAVGAQPPQVEALPQTLDEVVLGQAHPLVGAHAVVAQVLLTVEAVRGGRVLLVAGAALRFSQLGGLQQAHVRMMEAGRTSNQASPMVEAVLVLDGLLRAHHHIQQVAEEEVGRGERVHPGLGDGHLLVTGGATQLERVPGAALALQTLPAEGVQAGQDVEPPAGLTGGR